MEQHTQENVGGPGHSHVMTDPGHSHHVPVVTTEAPAPAAEATAKPKKEKKAKEPKAPKEPKVKAEKPVVAKVEKDVKHGVNRPGAGVTKLVWDTADLLSTEKKSAVDRAALVKALEGKVEVGTIHTQYGRWRKYYGLTETKEQRQARLKVVRDAKDADKAAKKAQKAADKAAEKASAEVKAEAEVVPEAAAE